MMLLNAIYARGRNGEFSLSDGSLPWKNDFLLSEDAKKDMEHFKKMTSGQVVIMGFNTYRTFSRPLPGRINVVIDRNCRNGNSIREDDFNFFNSLESALDFFTDEKSADAENSCRKLYLIGGAKLIEHALKKKKLDGKIYETVFDLDFPLATVHVKEPEGNWQVQSAIKLSERTVLYCKIPTD